MYTLLAVPKGLLLALEYGLCFVLILLSLIILIVMRRQRINELRAETVVKSCKKALVYAEKMIEDKEHKGKHILLGSTKLGHLSSLVSESAWYAYQIGYKKQDLFFESISKDLDNVAGLVTNEAENVYILVTDYIVCTEKTVEQLRMLIEKIEKYNK
jgi:hypothetical protein